MDEIRDTWADDEGIERPWRAEDYVRRTQNGRPYIRKIDETGRLLDKEVPYSRVTTYIKCVDDMSRIHARDLRLQAQAFAKEPEYFAAEVMRTQHSDRDLDWVSKRALERAGADDRAAIGTAVHALTERYDRGLDLGFVPSYYLPSLKSWKKSAQSFPSLVIEEMVVNDGLRTAGTPDRIVRYLPCSICGAEYYILDLKTGRVDRYTALTIAMQLAVYAHSLLYDIKTGERISYEEALGGPVCLHRGIIVKITPDGGDLTFFASDLVAGWSTVVDVVSRVRKARRLKGLLTELTPEPL